MRLALLVAVLSTTVLVTSASAPAAGGRARVLCSSDGTTVSPKSKPKKCAALPPGAPFGLGANLGKLKWKSWGGKTARATGIEKGFHLPYSHIPVTVRAYRRRSCGADRVYTRIKVTSSNGSTTVRYRSACSDQPER